MRVEGISFYNIISNTYNNNIIRGVESRDNDNLTDRIELSEVGKSLNNYSLKNLDNDRISKINELRQEIKNGTYNVDAKLTAKSIMECFGGRGI